MNLEEYITAREAAEIIGIHRESLKALLRDGKVEGEKLGGTWMVKTATAEAEKARRGR